MCLPNQHPQRPQEATRSTGCCVVAWFQWHSPNMSQFSRIYAVNSKSISFKLVEKIGVFWDTYFLLLLLLQLLLLLFFLADTLIFAVPGGQRAVKWVQLLGTDNRRKQGLSTLSFTIFRLQWSGNNETYTELISMTVTCNALYFNAMSYSATDCSVFLKCLSHLCGGSGLTLVSLHLAQVYRLRYLCKGLQTTRRGLRWLLDICSTCSIRSYTVQGARMKDVWQTDN